MTTFPIEMLQLPNFDHVTQSTITFESRDTMLLVMKWSENMMVIIFTSDCSDFKKVWSSHFSDIIKTTITSVSATFENSIKVKKNKLSINLQVLSG